MFYIQTIFDNRLSRFFAILTINLAKINAKNGKTIPNYRYRELCGPFLPLGELFDELRSLGEPVYSFTDSLVEIKGAMRDGRITETSTVAKLETVELSVIAYAQDPKR